jgi:hypothetical protein
MYFEGNSWKGSALKQGSFTRCTFMNVDLSGASWTNCRFVECGIDGLTLNEESHLDGTVFDPACVVMGVLIRTAEDDSRMRSYVPDQCRAQLERVGAAFETETTPGPSLTPIPDEVRKTLDAFFRIFSRNTGASENVVRMKLGPRFTNFSRKLLPLLLRRNVVRKADYVGRGQQERFELCFPIETILRAEDSSSVAPRNLKAFWEDIRQ